MHPELLDPVKREKRRREVDLFLSMFDLMDPDEQERVLRKIEEIKSEMKNTNK